MTLLSVDELKELVGVTQGICISLFMPTIKAGDQTQQNPIRFKNMIRSAEAQLADYGLEPQEASAWLQPALDLDQADFWQHQDQGLAIFIGDNFFRYYCLPLNVQELVVVSDRFHLKPIMPLLYRDFKFYILALSQKSVRFFEATRYSI